MAPRSTRSSFGLALGLLCACASLLVTDRLSAQTAASGKPIEIQAETMTGIANVMAPYQGALPPGTPPTVDKAVAALKKEQLVRPPPPPAVNDLAQRLGTALQLGNRTAQFLPELAKVSDAAASGSQPALNDAITSLWQKAGRSGPAPADLAKLGDAVRSATSATRASAQHFAIAKPDYTVKVDHSPGADGTKVSVLDKDANGQPQRTTFSDTQTTQANKNSGLDTVTQPNPPRQVIQQEADKQRLTIDGAWTDQEGHKWEISGAAAGGPLSIVETLAGGHRVTYASKWELGMVSGSHPIDNVADMDDGLPMDVRQALASQWHPPFNIELEFMFDTGEFRGSWISGQVTYSGMAHTISVVDDPTWDKPLVLTREPRGRATVDFFAGAGITQADAAGPAATPSVEP